MTDGPSFTPRQKEIANGINRELSYKQIACELGISEHTVRAHVIAMAEKIPEFEELPPRWRIFSWIRAHGFLSTVARLAKETG